jgi:PTH1 family peptidyl-tRNA hydrolase
LKLIFGLGNPGSEYESSPHNLGFAVVDRLAERNSVRLTRRQALSLCGRFESGGEEVWLIKPQTFMNRSGEAVKKWMAAQGCGPEDIVVIYDELDLPWGTIRIRQKGGAAGNHGLESILAAIGTNQFTRVRIGVDPERHSDTVGYLLTPMGPARRRQIEPVVDTAAEAAETILREGAPRAMNRFNRASPAVRG